MKTKKHYSLEEIEEILKKETTISDASIDAISHILDCYDFLALKSISKAIKKIAKGK